MPCTNSIAIGTGHTRAYKGYALALMTAIYTLNLIDRGLMMLLLQPIKIDLNLSDTQMGFVTGIAFALFYATAGLPIARWADRGDRSTITASAIGLWGLTVMCCVFVANFPQLVMARIAAAVGEAGCKPPTYSLIGDYFPAPAERARAMGVYWLGSPLAALIAFVIGGWLNDLVGWRMTFFIMGAPGIALAVLAKLTLREPRRNVVLAKHEHPGFPSVAAVFSMLWRQRSSRHLAAAIVLFFFLGYGAGPWFAAFLLRNYEIGVGELGMQLGLINGVCGVLGIVIGGAISARLFLDNERAQMRTAAMSMASAMVAMLAFLNAPNVGAALAFYALYSVATAFIFAPAFTLLQRLVDDRMRATSLAIVMLLANLVGMGLGPQLVGVLSDLSAPWLGAGSLRVALMVLSVSAVWCAFHFWRAGATVHTDLVAMERSGISKGEPSTSAASA